MKFLQRVVAVMCLGLFTTATQALASGEQTLEARELTGIYCNSVESAEFVAAQMLKRTGLRGIERAHIALHIQRGRTRYMRSGGHLWCDWTTKRVRHPVLFDQSPVKGEIYEVLLPSMIDPILGIRRFDIGMYYIGGTSLSPFSMAGTTSTLFWYGIGPHHWGGPAVRK